MYSYQKLKKKNITRIIDVRCTQLLTLVQIIRCFRIADKVTKTT